MVRILLVLILGFCIFLFFLRAEETNPLMAQSITIGELLEQPEEHDGAAVAVTGQVQNRASLFGVGGFQMTDQKGDTITVVGLSSPKAPGSVVTVRGTFMAAFSLNDLLVPVVLVGSNSL
ncbi:hypothetical protein [Marivita sp. XM-24bin2]|uniref:hypothetical protein n=1 Tax=Marivita sp. XM-24bin2 TaxID=2133951 RepID=UPI000D795E54|nr:hypothetical protein [Marivita sp. XM-24bin2]PWL33560.1 MAG: hypothetical protein DCO97_18870 [Marivita sp. XM-24bin2]